MNEALRRIRLILNKGTVTVFDHCKEELEKDDLGVVDAVNVLRCGNIHEPAEPKFDRWRYRVHTGRMCVVVQFESTEEIAIVTAWRKKQ